MLKNITAIILTVTMGTAQANEEKNKVMFDMIISTATSSANQDIEKSAKCFGVSKTELDQIFEKAMNQCFEDYKTELFEAYTAGMEQCLEPMIAKVSRFSEAKLNACRNDEYKQKKALVSLDSLDNDVDRISDALDALYEQDAPESEIVALEARLDQLAIQQKQAVDALDAQLAQNYLRENVDAQPAEMENVMKSASKSSAKTLHLVTLPMYKKSQVMMHLISGSQMGSESNLPAVTFVSPDPVKKIVDFYRKALPNYSYKALADGQHLLMETMPKNFDFLRHSREYISTPHVLIHSIEDKPLAGVVQGAKSNIQISYRER